MLVICFLDVVFWWTPSLVGYVFIPHTMCGNFIVSSLKVPTMMVLIGIALTWRGSSPVLFSFSIFLFFVPPFPMPRRRARVRRGALFYQERAHRGNNHMHHRLEDFASSYHELTPSHIQDQLTCAK